MGTPGPEALIISHWFAAVMTTVFAALPWIKWRYSLRTLLIGMTLMVAILGAIAYALK
jgi:hypothetical protein